MMLVWYPILKVLILAVALYFASAPLRSHARLYDTQMALRKKGESYRSIEYPLPTTPVSYLPLLVVLMLYVMVPVKLAHMDSSERTLQSMDSEVLEAPPIIEQRVKKQYQAPDNRAAIQSLMESTQ
jgi:hypothetical protein